MKSKLPFLTLKPFEDKVKGSNDGRLSLHILQRAIDDCFRPTMIETELKEETKLEARKYIFSDNIDHCYSYLNCCERAKVPQFSVREQIKKRLEDSDYEHKDRTHFIR